MELPVVQEKEYLNIFKISIFMKGLNAFFEIFAGIIIGFTSKIVLVNFIFDIFRNELSDEPGDILGNFIVNSAVSISTSSQYFFAIYLILHGIIKITLIINLFRKKLWAYPSTIIIFSLFIFYELYRFYISHSVWILAFTIFDMLIVFLTIHEYRVLLRRKK